MENPKKGPIIGYNMDGSPYFASEVKRQYAKDLKEVAQGKFVTMDKLKKEAAQWLAYNNR